MGPNQTEKLLHSERNRKQNKNATYRAGENACKQCNQKQLNLQNIPTIHTTQEQQQPKSKNE